MAKDLGKISITPKGEWTEANKPYEILDAVTANGGSYLSLKDNNEGEVTDETAWMVIAEKGEQGDKGIQGEKGEPGRDGERGEPGPQGKYYVTEGLPELIPEGDIILYNNTLWRGTIASDSISVPIGMPIPIKGYIELEFYVTVNEGNIIEIEEIVNDLGIDLSTMFVMQSFLIIPRDVYIYFTKPFGFHTYLGNIVTTNGSEIFIKNASYQKEDSGGHIFIPTGFNLEYATLDSARVNLKFRIVN